MTTRPSKSQQIRALLKQGLADLDIAQRVGCRESYVRSVRQRTSPFGDPIVSAADRKWLAENADQRQAWWRKYRRRRYQTDPEFRERQLGYARAYQARRRAEARAS